VRPTPPAPLPKGKGGTWLPKPNAVDWQDYVDGHSRERAVGLREYLNLRPEVDNVSTRSYIYTMKSVGLRELKNRLSQYVRQVRLGEGFLVTDRGQVVAELTPPAEGRAPYGLASVLAAMAAKGEISAGAANMPEVYPLLTPLLVSRGSQQLLDEERGGR
jgi:prevent-host-death family protein